MGRSSKKLTKAIHDSYDEMNKRAHHTDIVEPDTEIITEKETREELLDRLTGIITNDLIAYSESNAYPLCEFLFEDEVADFIDFVVKA